MRHWLWQQEPRDKRGRLGGAQDGAWSAGPQQRRRKGRAGPARHGAARRSAARAPSLGRPQQRAGALPPSTTAARRRSLGPGARGIPWGLTPRPQTRSGRQNWARRAARRPGRHGKLPRPLPLAGPCLGPAAPWPNRCVRRRRAASEPSRPGRCRPSTLRTQNVGSPDGREGSWLQTFQEPKANSHFAVSATEAQEPMSKGRVSEGSATWRRPLQGLRSIGVRYEAEGDKIASSTPPRGIESGTSVLLRSEAANSLVALPVHRASAGPGTSLGLGALLGPQGLRSYPAGFQSPG